jgi:hypothetical protein
MGLLEKALCAGVILAGLTGCAAPDPFADKALFKGEPLDLQNILAANPNKRACIEYEAATNSCASLITARVEGNVVIAHEVGAIKIPGTGNTQRVEVVTRSTLRGGQSCARSSDVTVAGRDTASALLLRAKRQLIDDFGGSVCSTYYRSGHGYVVSTLGANGEAFPPGDTRFQFIIGEASVRAH